MTNASNTSKQRDPLRVSAQLTVNVRQACQADTSELGLPQPRPATGADETHLWAKEQAAYNQQRKDQKVEELRQTITAAKTRRKGLIAATEAQRQQLDAAEEVQRAFTKSWNEWTAYRESILKAIGRHNLLKNDRLERVRKSGYCDKDISDARAHRDLCDQQIRKHKKSLQEAAKPLTEAGNGLTAAVKRLEAAKFGLREAEEALGGVEENLRLAQEKLQSLTTYTRPRNDVHANTEAPLWDPLTSGTTRPQGQNSYGFREQQY